MKPKTYEVLIAAICIAYFLALQLLLMSVVTFMPGKGPTPHEQQLCFAASVLVTLLAFGATAYLAKKISYVAFRMMLGAGALLFVLEALVYQQMLLDRILTLLGL